MIEIQVLRFDREKDKEPYFEKFSIEEKEKMNILDGLNYINNKYNLNLSFRSSCRAAQCGSCGLKLNNEAVLACKSELRDGDIISPLDFPVLKDLIVDKSEIDEKVAIMNLFLVDETYFKNKTHKKEDKKKNPLIIPSIDCENTKRVRSCIECYSCLSSCPVIKQSTEFAGPYFMRYLSKFDFDPRDKEDRTRESVENGLYSCTSCGKCSEVCPKNINSFSDAIEKLRVLAYEKDLGPLDVHKNIKKIIAKTGRSVEPSDEGFIKKINMHKKDSRNKIAIFTGCMVDYRLQDIGFGLMDVLKKNGISADVPEEQVCCGSPLLRTGQIDLIKDLVSKNFEVLSKYDTIITLCAGCGATLKNDYPKYGAKLDVLDISEFLVDKLNTVDMKPLGMKVTYHDPCHLIRGQGISKQPRDILNKIKGVEFIEMESSDQCCGSGGGVKAGKPEIARALSKEKVELVKKVDVDAVITICPFCQYNIQDGLNEEGLNNVSVMNILELLKKSYS
ncbi:MAG: succinate dehydrogenase/fumarate reductase iron-sulfur subunit [Methanobrevibacter sp.]|jgi:fumarate reductase (CoM/CoB) subunit B|nr:succinate dehydrogenase/fumarate reductase iron-sulfur subunit [Methanobrevibacter sp.]